MRSSSWTTALPGLLVLLPTLVASVADYPTSCTTSTASKRKEWSTMTSPERVAFIDAMQCVTQLPSTYPDGEIPAATSKFLDFTAVHASLARSVHISGTFLSWHREFVHLMEEALHSEQCGYPHNMGIPYMDWPKYTTSPLAESTIFDGSPDSMGSNGLQKPNREAVEMLGTTIPPGTGGGCVYSGPFSDLTVTFGPFGPQTIQTGLPDDWKEPNPRCLSRDLNDSLLRTFDNAEKVANLTASPTIRDFLWNLTPNNTVGIHGGGHAAVGGVGGNMADFYASPQDPAFFLHHGNLDRLWAEWQTEHEDQRYAYNGTSTIFNPMGVTPEVDNSTVISFGALGESITLGEAGDPMKGRYCYMYV